MSNIKLASKLAQKKFRNEFKLFLAEGLRLCEEVEPSQVEFGFFTREFLSDARATALVEKFKNLEEISSSTMKKISETQTPQGILLVVRQKFSSLEKILEKTVVVLDGVQDPGNVGTILRTTAAFDCSAIILDGSAEIFNPKVVRASMGAIFFLPIVKMSHEEFLNLRGVEILAATVDNSAKIYYQHQFKANSAIVFGSEANGVSKKILGVSKKIFIPMSPRVESLNVATCAAIILSEISRTRL